MESKTNYTTVGLIVLLLTTGLTIAMIWLSVGFDRKDYEAFTIYLGESVNGLSEDSPVKYNGVKVGYVDKIEIDKVDPQQVKIQIQIEEGTPITTATEATLITQGITGTTFLGLSATSSSPFPLQKTPGEPFPVIPYHPSFLSQIEKNLTDMSQGIKRVFDKENARAVKEALKNLQKISRVIANNNQNLHQSLKELPKLIEDLKISVNKFGEMSTQMSRAGKQVSATMKTGRNTIDKISQQTLPPMVTLLQRLDSIAANLEAVSSQIRQNPAVIIRGSSPPQPGPGE